MSNRNSVQRAYDLFGRRFGSEKKSGSWCRRSEEVASVLNLQKSQYGPKYYLNLGFWILLLDHSSFPRPHQAHIGIRAETLLPDVHYRLDDLLDLEVEMGDDERIEELLDFLDEHVLPVFQRADSIDGLRSLLDDGTFELAGITPPAREFLQHGPA